VLPVTDASQERLQVVFTDIYTPNGVKIIGEFAGADVTGAEGLVGKVETRLIERVGFPLATAALPITMAYTLPASSTTDEDRMNSAIQSISQSLQPILNSELDRYINTMPRITIEAGTLLTIKPENDIVFKPHLGGKYIPTWQ
jgi:type IV secretory pathway VirB10-like protein